MIDAAIGRTPLVRLEKVVEPEMAEVWMKMEGANPGGSIKDRTALGMITDAEERGVLRPGGTIVEPTSGNTGIGLAQVAATRGYKLILCLPSQMSEERKRTLVAYGARLVLTDPERRMLAAIEEAERIRDTTGAWMPNQFSNPANPRVHYRVHRPRAVGADGRPHRRVRVWLRHGRHDQRRGPLHQGTLAEDGGDLRGAGALTGAERRRSADTHQFQGMGPGFVPDNFDRSVVDRIVTAWEEDAFPLARRLAREEGLFVGMSSGAIAFVALQIARELGPGKRIAWISPDSGSRYLTTELFAAD